MTVQIIKRDGQPEWAVIPYETYQRLAEDAEMLQDIRDYDEARRAIEEGEELVPSQVVDAILEGESPIRVWRKHRGLTQQQLAEAAGISVPYLSQIESSERKGSTDVLAAIARALDLMLDDIVES
jgi:DNA-binding XRE family transcriptional regulator